ncbi:ATP-binding protein [Pyxidicoccus fallax]|uniref:ATP-binding protein n=1 Tax=Pyxidicoccus fallax TaxID=394095 RepID=A0A848LU85_9BACT|nr:ATP-binding protein [Pyxidicoccus fallax]NMO21567.1 ATP-binding protein [Pyxidicoccus fallax]NPC82792.1 ATP-binding protein [Pyxidicoccus fallax]
MELVLFIGLQGSGKSSFYRQRFADTHVLVSKDLWPHARRKEARQRRYITEALAAGRSVVVDNTNPSPELREPLIALGREHGARVIGYCFASDLKLCLERNARREGRARVPDVALFATVKQLRRPSRAEGFDVLYHVTLCPEGDFRVEDWREETDGTR